MATDMATDMASSRVQSLIDKFEQLAARSSGRPAPSPAPRRRRARCASDCSLALSNCDALALRRHFPSKLSMDMTSTTSTTSISSDDEDEEDAIDVDDVDCEESHYAMEVELAARAEEKQHALEDSTADTVALQGDSMEQPLNDEAALDNQPDLSELEPIVPVTLPPIDETAPELDQPSDADELVQPAAKLTIDCSEESHGADCGWPLCRLQDSGELSVMKLDNQVDHKAPSPGFDTTGWLDDFPLTLEDLCTLHVEHPPKSNTQAAPAAAKPSGEPRASRALQPSKIPRPRISYSSARRASVGPNTLTTLAPVALIASNNGAASGRRNSLAASPASCLPATRKPTQSRRSSIAGAASKGAPSVQTRRSTSTDAAVSSRSIASQDRRNSIAGLPTSTRTSAVQTRRNSSRTSAASASTLTADNSVNQPRTESAPASIGASRAADDSPSAVTSTPRPRYLDYARSPRFAALKAQNLERRRLAEERSRAHAAVAKTSPRRPAALEHSLALSSASSLASSTASSPCSSSSSASLASSLPPRTTRRLDQVRSRLFDFRSPQPEALSDRGGRTRLAPCAQMRSQST